MFVISCLQGVLLIPAGKENIFWNGPQTPCVAQYQLINRVVVNLSWILIKKPNKRPLR